MNYDFYITTKDILFKFNNDLEVLVKSGEPLLRVGYGLAHPELPVDSISSLNYMDYKNKKLISKVEDELLTEEFVKEFDYIIDTVQKDMTNNFLTMISVYEEFIKIPKILKNNTLDKINNFFIEEGGINE